MKETVVINVSEKVMGRIQEYIVNKNKRLQTIIDKYTTMKEEGHIEMVDCDMDTPLKVQRAVPLTEKGKKFLNGSDTMGG